MINDPSQNKKPLIFYMAVAVIVIILLNAFVFPMLLQRQVQEVGYSDFLKMVDSKQVSEVSMDENGEQLILSPKAKTDRTASIRQRFSRITVCANGWRMPEFRFPHKFQRRTIC